MRIDPVRYSGAPVGERRPNEMAVYAFLDKLAIPYDRCDHDYANTMEDCKAIEGVLEAPICKNLLLTNRKQTDFYCYNANRREEHASQACFSRTHA